jgi:hypothetical protein
MYRNTYINDYDIRIHTVAAGSPITAMTPIIIILVDSAFSQGVLIGDIDNTACVIQ